MFGDDGELSVKVPKTVKEGRDSNLWFFQIFPFSVVIRITERVQSYLINRSARNAFLSSQL